MFMAMLMVMLMVMLDLPVLRVLESKSPRANRSDRPRLHPKTTYGKVLWDVVLLKSTSGSAYDPELPMRKYHGSCSSNTGTTKFRRTNLFGLH